MAYTDTPEFQEKAAAFRKARDTQRSAHGRAVFEAESAETADAAPVAEVLAKIKSA